MVKSVKPKTLEQCLEVIQEGFYWKFAGGTDLMIRKRQWHGAARKFEKPVVLIGDLNELKGIYEFEDRYEIMAGATLTEIVHDTRLPNYLREPIKQMASPPIRNIATMGGNVCNAAKVADSIPVLFALNARVVLIKSGGERTLPIEEFMIGKYKTMLEEDELLYKIIVPKVKCNIYNYKKLGTRKGSILSKLSFLGIANVEEGKLTEFSVSIGAINDRPLCSISLEKKIMGMDSYELAKEKASIVASYKALMDGQTDKRSTKEYREKTACKFIEVFLNEIIGKMGGQDEKRNS